MDVASKQLRLHCLPVIPFVLTLFRKIAWSKSGCVANITPDGNGINLRVFSRDPITGKWDLGKETALDVPHALDSLPFVHLSWSHLGNDLAIMNAAGHVMIYSCAMVLDRMTLMRADSIPQDAEMDSVVGMHWLAILPYEQKVGSDPCNQ